MLKGSILTLALVVGLIAVAGVAVAAIGSNDSVAGGDGVAVAAPAMVDDDSSGYGSTSTSTTQIDDDDDVEVATPTTTLGDIDDDGGPMPVAAPMDDDSADDGSMSTATTTTMGNDSDDDGYDDDGDDDYPEYMIPDDNYVVDASPAGSVTVVVRGGMIVDTLVDIDPVWMLHKFDEKRDEVELGFYWGESELKIKVEIDDGQLKKMVEFDLKDDGDDDYAEYMIPDDNYVVDASPAGSVTVVVRGGMIVDTLVDIDPVWMPYKFDEKRDEVELGFYWGESELKIKVEIDDGQLKKYVDFDMK